jgi:hypothetical protein
MPTPIFGFFFPLDRSSSPRRRCRLAAGGRRQTTPDFQLTLVHTGIPMLPERDHIGMPDPRRAVAAGRARLSAASG